MKKIIPKTKYYFYGLIIAGAVMTSFTSVFVELTNVGPTVSAFYRVFFGGMILLAIALIRKERLWRGFAALKLPIICALFFGIDLFFWHRSILFVGPGLATLLGNMQVFFVALFAVIFLGEILGWKRKAAIPLAATGLYFILKNGWGMHSGQFKLGVLFGLMTAIAYAAYILFLRESQSEKKNTFPPITNMALICLCAALLLGIVVFVEPAGNFVIPDLQSWGALLGLAVIGQAAGWVTISKALPHVEASAAGLVLLIQPALSFCWDILFFNRPTVFIEYVGIIIVLGAIYMGSFGNNK